MPESLPRYVFNATGSSASAESFDCVGRAHFHKPRGGRAHQHQGGGVWGGQCLEKKLGCGCMGRWRWMASARDVGGCGPAGWRGARLGHEQGQGGAAGVAGVESLASGHQVAEDTEVSAA